jgi:hypothetical protein
MIRDTATRATLDSALSEDVAPWLADEFLESYVSWREEAAAVRGAYDRWRVAHLPDLPLAYAAYRAALDREEHAAGALRDAAKRILAAQK